MKVICAECRNVIGEIEPKNNPFTLTIVCNKCREKHLAILIKEEETNKERWKGVK